MTSATPSDTKSEARVLVVDDEANIVELLSVSLKFQGFEVYTATNGAQALDRARAMQMYVRAVEEAIGEVRLESAIEEGIAGD